MLSPGNMQVNHAGNRDSNGTKTTSSEASCVSQPCPDRSTDISTSNKRARKNTRLELS
ncbi:hypothetical protein BKA82DRAFT_867419 [Pisolithus tinctorius]|uniref:Uncharacterized protein n=1 Tax=Pisolithus tinctorius Marx 270 TaxID=870435 RepID=A0A0C3JK08_PISTI|nr:hypothetical protein BKA82DRAFT_867419 [Pisolithus tinctorius]KIN97906.1 hypothetical protein M404DRAFT_867419 [Pisolithus tinctorius Marx 270]